MIKAIRKLLMIGTMSALFLTPLAAPATAGAAVLTGSNHLSCGANADLAATSCTSANNAVTVVQNIVTIAINIFSVVVGLVCVVMIIIGGLKYVTSNGDAGAVSGAKNTILYAIVGLVIVALAQLIVKFVLNKTQTAGG
ncbi:MAG TPA: hypothetical protein VLF39_04235 [Candidatus Saccharimonadales bacterium]|nr:hypothetical protein [Candidatus Saccharimonadales bacterium]